MKICFKRLTLCPLLSALCLSALAGAMPFTYQGRLNIGANPANGSYDVAFTLFNTNVTGAPLAGPVTNSAVAVSNGLFTTTVALGGAITGDATWLEIAVSTNGANLFTTLTPRQQLTPVPLALLAGSAGNLLGTVNTSQLTGGIPATNLTRIVPDSALSANAALRAGGNGFTGNQVVMNGYVGVGTANPQAPLDVVGANSYPHLRVAADAAAPYGAFFALDASATEGGQDYLIFSTGGTAGEGQGKLVFQDHSNGKEIMTMTPEGNVGIGQTSPAAALDVAGTINATSFTGNGAIPVGGIILWSGATAPAGWALCDGGNGTPDLRGRFVLGSGTGTAPNNTPRTVGQSGGEEKHTLTIDEMPSHSHQVPPLTIYVNTIGYTSAYNSSSEAVGAPDNSHINSEETYQTSQYVTYPTGGSVPFDKLPPYYVLAYIMRVQ